MTIPLKELLLQTVTSRNQLLSRMRRIMIRLTQVLEDPDQQDPNIVRAHIATIKLLEDTDHWNIPFDIEAECIESICNSLLPDEVALRKSLSEWQKRISNLNYCLGIVGTYLNRKSRIQFTETDSSNASDSFPNASQIEYLRELNRKLLFTEIILENTTMEAVPLTYCIDPASSCNYRCRTCFQSETQLYYQTTLSLDVIKKISLALPFADEIKLFGIGEPTLSPQLPLFCELIAQSHVKANLLTNGSTLGKKNIPFENLAALGISFDGAKKRTFETIRVGSRFDTLLEKIAEVRQQAPDICLYLNSTINRANVDEIAGIAEIGAKLGVNRINYTKMLPYMVSMKDFELAYEDIPLLKSQLAEAMDIGQKYGIQIDSSILLDDLKPSSVPRNKEDLLTRFESIKVVGSGVHLSLEAALRGMEYCPFQLYPPDNPLYAKLRHSVEQLSSKFPHVDTSWLTFQSAILEKRLAVRLSIIDTIPEHSIRLPYCMSPWVKMFIDAEGSLKPCCVFASFAGDITGSATFEDAWNSGELVQIRRSTTSDDNLYSKCKNCNFAERYLFLDSFLQFIESCGKDITRIVIPKNYMPPEYIKQRLQSKNDAQIDNSIYAS